MTTILVIQAVLFIVLVMWLLRLNRQMHDASAAMVAAFLALSHLQKAMRIYAQQKAIHERI